MIQTDLLKARKDNICVPIMAASAKQLISEGIAVEDYESCQFVELRIDYIKEDIVNNTVEMIEYLKKQLEGKLFIVTYRTVFEGGTGNLGFEVENEAFTKAYKELLINICQSVGCHFVDVEYNRGLSLIDELAATARDNNIAIISSYHNFNQVPDNDILLNIAEKMKSSQTDILKLAVMPKSVDDVARYINFTKQLSCMTEKPIITMAMGELGRVTRVFGYRYGSSLTFGAVGQGSAPGQLQADKLRELIDKTKNIKITLTGFMGSGKSAISKSLEGLISTDLADTDDLIVEREGRTIPDIFAQSGEPYFRQVETAVLEDTMNYEGALIVSCGGGIIKSETNRQILKEKAATCFLSAKPATILERVKDDNNRPLLVGKKNVEAIEAMIKERQPFYDMVADFVVETDGKAISAIAVEILEKIVEKY